MLNPELRYRAEIDGLRALAVVPVILFHAGIQSFSGGFIGVDVFFVISGYLITNIIYFDIKNNRFSVINFYERRARRILPALFLVVIACIPFSLLWLMLLDMKDFSQSVFAVAMYSSNILFWLESDYFAPAAELKPLLHTWSLAIEEQYYIFFPWIMLASLPIGKRGLLVVLTTILLVSLFSAEWTLRVNPSAAFYLLPTRAWELMLGGLVAILLADRPTWAENFAPSGLLSGAGLAAIIFAIFAYDRNTSFPGLYALIPTLGAAIVIAFTHPGVAVYKLLSHPWMVQVGLVSYSAYLVHQPLFSFARYKLQLESHSWFMISLTVIIFPIAYVIWKLVEKPFRNRNKISRRALVLWCGGATSILLIFGIVGHLTNGFQGRFDKDTLDILTYATYDRSTVYREGTCFLMPKQSYSDFAPECLGDVDSDTVLWGDSHAAALSYGVRMVFPKAAQLTASRCPPLIGINFASRPNCQRINDQVLNYIANTKPERVLLHASWITYQGQLTSLKETISAIHQHSSQTEVIMVGGSPRWSPDLPTVMLRSQSTLARPLVYLENPELDPVQKVDQEIIKIIVDTGATVRLPLEQMCRGKRCLATVQFGEQIVLSAWDYGHLTAGGSVYWSKQLFIGHL